MKDRAMHDDENGSHAICIREMKDHVISGIENGPHAINIAIAISTMRRNRRQKSRNTRSRNQSFRKWTSRNFLRAMKVRVINDIENGRRAICIAIIILTTCYNHIQGSRNERSLNQSYQKGTSRNVYTRNGESLNVTISKMGLTQHAPRPSVWPFFTITDNDHGMGNRAINDIENRPRAICIHATKGASTL